MVLLDKLDEITDGILGLNTPHQRHVLYEFPSDGTNLFVDKVEPANPK